MISQTDSENQKQNIENVFEIINKNIPKSIDIKCSVCYDKTVAGACAQAFSTSEELPELDSPAGEKLLRICALSDPYGASHN